MKVNDIWDFVTEYYPNYGSCDSIAYNNDIQCIVDGELHEDSCAEEIYNEKLEEFIRSGMSKKEADEAIEKWAEQELIESNEDIYRRAIEGFIAAQKD